jgi:imidazolonepropionase-like amidohydrolase
VTFAITSPGDNAAATRFLALGGAASVAGGLDADAALAAVTSRAAKILGVADRVGSLEVGKDGDLVIASAEPFSSLSVVEKVVIDGDVVFER